MISFKDKPWFQYSQNNWKTRTATIIGAGIAGCQLAYHLEKQGWETAIIDQNNTIADNASGNPAGIIAPKVTATPSAAEDFYCQAFDYTEQQLSILDNSSNYWHPCGVLQIATLSRDQKRFNKIAQRTELENTIQYLNPIEATQLAGIKIKESGLYYPRAGWVDPRSLCQALVKTTRVILNHSVLTLSYDKCWTITDSNKEIIAQSEIVIFCTGNQQITPYYQPPIIPIAGQTSYIETSETISNPKLIIDHQGYIIPNIQPQQSLIGASYHRNKQRSECLEKDNQANLALQYKHLPKFAQHLKVSNAHCATRATTPDRLPYVGGIPIKNYYQKEYGDIHQGRQWKNYPIANYEQGLFTLNGFGSRGLTTAALCAKLLVNLLENQTGQADTELLQKLHPARFIISALKQNCS